MWALLLIPLISSATKNVTQKARTKIFNLATNCNTTLNRSHCSPAACCVQGPAGAQGSVGPRGGPQGIHGIQGAPGVPVTGPTGLTGPTGAPGPIGGTGAQGATGNTGLAGAGSMGRTGPTGQTGSGPQGPDGNAGNPGNPGPNGTVAFSMFYGLSTSDAYIDADNNPIPVAPNGPVPFPSKSTDSLGSIDYVPTFNTKFTLPNIGYYEVTFRIFSTNQGQVQLRLNDAAVVPGTVATFLHPCNKPSPESESDTIFGLIGSYIVQTTAPATISVINCGSIDLFLHKFATGSHPTPSCNTITIKQIT